jgi:HlyD family secretion protein
MFAQAQILVAERSGLAVPITALGVAEGRAFVLRVTGTTANRVEVETGIRDGAWVEITAGLAAGDLLVAKAGAFVRDGDTITPLLTPTPTN